MKFKKKTAISVVAAIALSATACFGGKDNSTPASAVFEGLNFSNGNISFLRIDHSRKQTVPEFNIELADFDGIPAAKIASQGKKIPWIGISASTLLSDSDIAKVDTVAIKIGLKSLDGTFWPMTGSIYAYSGADLTETSSKIGIQTPESNPKIVYSKLAKPLAAGKNNYIMFAPSQDDGTAYTGKNDIYILGIGFRDVNGNYLPINVNAGEDFPANFDVTEDEGAAYKVALGAAPYESAWLNFNSTDGTIPLEAWQQAKALVVEYAPRKGGESPIDTNPDAGKFVVQVVGGALEQGWREIPLSDGLVEQQEGKSLTLSLDGIKDVTEVQNIGYGAWDGADTITGIYLVTAYNAESKGE